MSPNRSIRRVSGASLPREPLRGRISSHRDPQQPPPSVAKNKKCEELLKGNRRNHKEINRCNPIRMIAKEGLPALQWPTPPRHHVDRNRGLGDLNAQFEQLAMDPRGTPERVLKTHYFGSDRAPLCRSAVGPRAIRTSIASR